MKGVCKHHFDTKIHYVCAIAIVMLTVSKSMAGGGVSLSAVCSTCIQEILRWIDKRTLVTPSSCKRVWKILWADFSEARAFHFQKNLQVFVIHLFFFFKEIADQLFCLVWQHRRHLFEL